MTALTFGNVHGVYKPGNVKLRPEVLEAAQQVVGKEYGKDKPFDLVSTAARGRFRRRSRRPSTSAWSR